MNEQTRIRLGIITDRYDRRFRGADAAGTEWLVQFASLCDHVLRSAMTEIGSELSRAGHACHLEPSTERETPGLDWTIEPRGAPGARRMIRIFARMDERKGWEILAEVWLSGTPCELTRFAHPNEVTEEVAEHLLVDAVEQVLAAAASSTLAAKQGTPG